MSIRFTSEVDTFTLRNELRYIAWLEKVTQLEGRVVGAVDYVFVEKEKILAINKQYLSHDYFTDVITFDDSYLDRLQGQIFICISVVIDNSIIHVKGNFEMELCRVVLHGMLHLIGYKDKTEQEIILMRSKEEQYLAILSEI